MSIRRILAGAIAALTLSAIAPQAAHSQYATLTGTLAASNGLPASNYLITFTPSQFGYIGGTGVVVNTTTSCATSTDGSVVGLRNPLVKPPVTVGFTGTLAPANYYVKYGFYDAAGNVTLVSPETAIQLTSTGRLIVASPSAGLPAGAVGMNVYISASTNTETLQGQTTGSASFIQSTPLATGTAVPSANTTVCKQVANDAIWPSGTGYTVVLVDTGGNTLPGYPMQWQLMGPNTTINLSSGLPYYHGTVYFPTPILASPLNHAQQSISGPLSLSGYNLTNVGSVGVGTSLPAWPIDVENGFINSNLGYLLNGNAGTTGQCPISGGPTGPMTWQTCLTTSTALYYQSAALNGTSVTQRPTMNFSSAFALTDSASPPRTNIDLAHVGTAGTFTSPTSITFDVYGRETAVTAGSAFARTCSGSSCYYILSDGTIIEWGTSASLPTGGYSTSVAVTFPHAITSPAQSTCQTTPNGVPGTATNLLATTCTSLTTTGVTITANTGFTDQPISNSVMIYWQIVGH